MLGKQCSGQDPIYIYIYIIVIIEYWHLLLLSVKNDFQQSDENSWGNWFQFLFNYFGWNCKVENEKDEFRLYFYCRHSEYLLKWSYIKTCQICWLFALPDCCTEMWVWWDHTWSKTQQYYFYWLVVARCMILI